MIPVTIKETNGRKSIELPLVFGSKPEADVAIDIILNAYAGDGHIEAMATYMKENELSFEELEEFAKEIGEEYEDQHTA